MWNQNPVNVLKLLAEFAIPVTIAIFGFLINKTIQRQNAIVQRQSSWLTKWADDFLKAAAGLDNSATSFIMAWYKTNDKLPASDEAKKGLQSEIVKHYLELQRAVWEIQKYAAFAPKNGKGLREAADALTDEFKSWSENKDRNIQEFLTKQITFNMNARNVHAELLGLRDSKD
jgi:hypothetical protein